MALFKKTTTAPKSGVTEGTKEVATVKTTVSLPTVREVLIRPRITEKATDLSEKNIYVFEVAKSANKLTVRQAIEKRYKVKPVKVTISNTTPKTSKNPRTGRVQAKTFAVKKAMVFLKKGDKIELV
jgi:large subunit ribosomal protein L23